MKKIGLIGISALFLAAGCLVYVQEPYDRPPVEEGYYEEGPPAGRVDTGYFYDQLSPFGYWVDMPGHGYVWIPNQVEYGWRPYTHGRWMWTDFGWTWVSEYRWGWAPFHYGRWGWDDGFGWFWVPGHTWGPAWVSWRHGTTYLGWAPLPPGVRFTAGVGITRLPRGLHHRYWVFVDGRYLTRSGLYRYVLPWERNPGLVGRTRVRTHIVHRNQMVINSGLELDVARRVSRRSIQKVRVSESGRPGATRLSARGIEIYRPEVERGGTSAPGRILPRSQVRERVSADRIRRVEKDSDAGFRDRQQREARLLKESQERESRDLQRRAEAEKRRAASSDEKRKVEREYETRSVRLKKEHTQEKSTLRKRHEKEKSTAAKTRVSKTAVKKKKKK